jgi:hypothetical protein
MDAPAGPGSQVLVVVAQVPDQVRYIRIVDAEMVCDTSDPT